MKYNNLIIMCLLLIGSPGFSQSDNNVTHDFSLEVEGEYRYFFKNGGFEGQSQHFPSLAIKPDYSISWNQGYDELNFVGFGRWDRDEKRTHVDLRELYYQRARGNWELGIGLKKNLLGSH